MLEFKDSLWYKSGEIILKEFYKAAGKEPPVWIEFVVEQSAVQESNEEKYFELRGFLQQVILEGYRRDSFTNPDPSTVDSNGKRMYIEVTFEQKINYCLENKSVPFLHICKRNLGKEIEVAITSNIRSELKKYDKSTSAIMTMNSLASMIPGFEYDLRSVGGQRVRVICGPKKKFLEFLNYEVRTTE